MPALQCQECGKALLVSDPTRSEDNCICSNCGRKVYARKQVKAAVKCPKCKTVNDTIATI
jgi:phage FluMu protein Com